jgi:D-alanyl-D-alanine carboxypeptidase (penicillin-binding protein 5/6)
LCDQLSSPTPFPSITAATAIVIDRDTGAVLGSKNPDTLRPNPSTTKMMTALIAMERNGANIDQIVGPISANAASTYGSTMGLQAGDTVSLRDMLYGLLLPSGNDAGVAIAEWISGTQDAFVTLMNQRAQQLGLTNTAYRNAFGYDPVELPAQCVPPYSSMFNCGHYSTARDLATLARFAMQEQPLFAQIVATFQWTPTTWHNSANVPRTVTLQNTNLLLSSIPYSGANGVKTGQSTSAGYCMVASATRSGHSVLTVVMGCASDQIRHLESIQLLDWGFSQLASIPTPTPTATPAPSPTPSPTPVSSPPPIVKVAISAAPGTINAGQDATFKISTSQVNLTASTTIQYTMIGRAMFGTDYSLSGGFGQAQIPAGAASTQVVLHSFNTTSTRRRRTATMKLLPGSNYRLRVPRKASVTIVGP